jgi:hypothetical protein
MAMDDQEATSARATRTPVAQILIKNGGSPRLRAGRGILVVHY